MAVRSQQIQIRVTPREKATLKRLARRAGQNLSSYVLSRAVPPHQATFDQILRLLRKDENRRVALAELNDFLARLASIELEEALQYADLRELSPLAQNYVAAMVEQAARQKGFEPPSWTREVVALDEPFFATPLRGLRPYLLRVAPVAFKRRNIFVDATVGDRV
ncbi:MAG: plasmid mobilization protein [Acidobacteriota bacterium]